MSAEILQLKNQQQAEFVCSACGSDRFCNCNAPALERLAKDREDHRQRSKAYRERKSQENQRPRDVTHNDDSEEINETRRENWRRSEDSKIGQENLKNQFLMGCAAAAQFTTARYRGPIDGDVKNAVRLAANAWNKLADAIEEK